MNNIYLVVLGICCFCSLVSFRFKYAFHLRMFSILLFIALVTEILANYFFRALGFKNNYTIYNVYVLLQLLGYAVFYWHVLSTAVLRSSIIATGILFIIFWVYTSFFYYNYSTWNGFAIMAGDAWIVLFSAISMYRLFTAERLINLRYSPEFWIAAGSIFYFSGEFPYTGTLKYMAVNFAEAAMLLKIVLQGLNIIMYSTFIYAFLCPRLKTSSMK